MNLIPPFVKNYAYQSLKNQIIYFNSYFEINFSSILCFGFHKGKINRVMISEEVNSSENYCIFEIKN